MVRGHGAVDVDVALTIGGRLVSGEATVFPRADGGRGYCSGGPCIDYWLSGNLVDALRPLGHADTDEVCSMIEASASEAAMRQLGQVERRPEEDPHYEPEMTND